MGFSDLNRPGFSVREELETGQDKIEFASGCIFENIGLNIEVSEETCLDEMLSNFNGSFPATRGFSKYARSILPDITVHDNHDAVLMAWMEREVILFCTPVTENKSKPDFIFPGQNEYHDPEFNESKLTMLGVKSSCKDRWRQVLAEANRIKNKQKPDR